MNGQQRSTSPSADPPIPLATKVARSAATLAGRRALIIGMAAISTAVVARFLGPAEFGDLASASAIFFIALTAGDFGFSLLLGREMAAEPERRALILRGVYRVQTLWSIVVASAVGVIALVIGLDSVRGQVLLILVPALAVSGLGGGRQVFLVLYRTGRLAAIDLTVNTLQVVATIAVAALGGGALGVALALSVGTIVNTAIVAWEGGRMVGRAGSMPSGHHLSLARRAAPLGVMSVMSRVYLSIDLVLLGWLVSAGELGEYAAATKLLALLVAVPGFATAAALPGFSEKARHPRELADLAVRVWHWLVVAGAPACIGVLLFAGPAIELAFGGEYAGAAPLVRVLALAGLTALMAGVLGTILVAKGIVYPLIVQNALAIAVNVGGLVLLAPVHGVIAAAWLTLVADVIVLAGSLRLLRGSLGMRRWAGVAIRPLTALLAGAVAALALAPWTPVAMIAFAAVYVATLSLLRGWPEEFRLRRGMRVRPA